MMHSRTIAVNQQKKQGRKKAFFSTDKPVTLTDEDIIKREMKSYELKKEEYLNKYEGQYIALLNGEVLDSDVDFSNLATRVYEKIGYRTVYMPLVTRHKKHYKISSPKLRLSKIV
jgi:hypothetical protein